MKNRVKISIDGKSFTLVGEETEEHMRQVATYIDH
ncbi:MAG: cell division protein ZapA, partial [Anaerotignum sp.]|nr:cell division protein ZapA [Anaerotignum sp.]